MAAKDEAYESFWYGFKNSVINFNHESPSALYEPIIKRISIVSNELNALQKQERYDDIIRMIETFLTDFLWVSLKKPYDSTDLYHLNIAKTNLKRWIALPNTANDRLFNLVKIICNIACCKKPHPDTFTLLHDIMQRDLDFVPIITAMTMYAYNHNMSTVFTQLLSDPECQKYTVAVLYKMGIVVPEHIRNGAKIFNI